MTTSHISCSKAISKIHGPILIVNTTCLVIFVCVCQLVEHYGFGCLWWRGMVGSEWNSCGDQWCVR